MVKECQRTPETMSCTCTTAEMVEKMTWRREDRVRGKLFTRLYNILDKGKVRILLRLLQQDMNRLEIWAEGSLIKFNKSPTPDSS